MNHKYVLFIVCVLAMCWQPWSVAEAKTSEAWEHAIRFPAGSTGQLMVHEGYAYVLNGWSRGDGILIFDIKDPAKPRFVRGLPAPGYLSGAAIHDQYMYLPTWFSMMVVQITEPAQARLVRNMFLGFPVGDAGSVAIDQQQQKLFLGGRGGGLRTFDISHPDRPTLVSHQVEFGRITSLTARAGQLIIQPHRKKAAWFDTRSGGMTNLAQLSLKGHVRWVGDALYESASKQTVLHDLSDPDHPRVAGQMKEAVPVGMMDTSHMLVQLPENQLAVWDVSDALKPQEVRQIQLPLDVTMGSAAVEGNLLYLIDRQRISLRIFDLAKDKARELGEQPIMRNAGHMAMADDGRVFLSYSQKNQATLLSMNAAAGSLAPFDANLHQLFTEKDSGFIVNDVHSAGNLARIGDYLLVGDGLVQAQPSSNGAVTFKTIHPINRPAAAIKVAKGVAYLAQNDRLTLLDVSHLPDLPVLGTYLPQGKDNRLTDVIPIGSLAYVIHNDRTRPRLEVIDLSTPAKPLLVSQCAIPPAMVGAMHGQYLYLPGVGGKEPAGMTIVDLSDPRQPRLVKTVDGLVDTSSYCVRVYNNQLYFTDSLRGIKVADLADPLNPRLVHTYLGPTDTSASFTDFDIRDGMLYGLRFSQIDVWQLIKD